MARRTRALPSGTSSCWFNRVPPQAIHDQRVSGAAFPLYGISLARLSPSARLLLSYPYAVAYT